MDSFTGTNHIIRAATKPPFLLFSKRLSLCLFLAFLWPAWGAAHNVVLPHPQRAKYGAGYLPLKGMEIQFTSTPSPEDQFAARELSQALGAKCTCVIPTEGLSKSESPVLLLRRTGPIDALPGADDRPGPDSRESYSIRVTPRGAEIRARTSAGLFYGVQTLRQMVEMHGREAVLPEVEIEDWPSLAYRGFMMDMSHGPLPTEEEVKRQIDFLARWKANQYYFYSEASIQLHGYPLLNPGARFTQEEVRGIVAYARERHIDVVPCVELFGHLHDLFRIERYSNLSPIRYGGELNPANPRVLPLLKDWIGQLTRLFPSPWFHIGFDEAWGLETFGSKAAGVSPSQLYLNYLKTVDDLVRARGKRVMFWADVVTGAKIFTRHPELFSQLPPGLIAAPWDYRPKKDYSPELAPLAHAGIPTVIATGVWSWNEVFPDFYRSFANIDGFLADGRKYGVIGLVNTGWMDDAQVLYRMSFPGMAYGAVAAWQSTPVDRAAFLENYCRQMYPAAAADDVASALNELTHSQEILGTTLSGPDEGTMHLFWDDPFAPALLRRSQIHEGELHQARLLAEDAQRQLYDAQRLAGNAPALPSLILGARMLDYLGMKYLYAVEIADYFKRAQTDPAYIVEIRRAGSQDHSLIADLMDDITTLRPLYRQAWLAEYTPYRLGTALGRWEAEYQYWRHMQGKLESFAATNSGEQIPSLENFLHWCRVNYLRYTVGGLPPELY